MNDMQITPETLYQSNQALVAQVNEDTGPAIEIIEETVYIALMAQMNDYTPSKAEVCVDYIYCTLACRKKLSGYKEQADSLVMQLRFQNLMIMKLKRNKDMVEARKLDIRKLHNDLSEARYRYLHFMELSEKLTIELDNLKSTF
ncbi:hypothetical protein Hanom_Chr05g00426091 [Helianthus anomalus]